MIHMNLVKWAAAAALALGVPAMSLAHHTSHVSAVPAKATLASATTTVKPVGLSHKSKTASHKKHGKHTVKHASLRSGKHSLKSLKTSSHKTVKKHSTRRHRAS